MPILSNWPVTIYDNTLYICIFYANVEYTPGLVRRAMGTTMEAEQAKLF